MPSTSSSLEAEQHEDDDIEGGGLPKIGVIRLPFLPQLGASPAPSARPLAPVDDAWLRFFRQIVDTPSEGKCNRRIIYLDGVSTMSASMPLWWSSLVEAVRHRRRTVKEGLINRRATTIVLSLAPSLISPHTEIRTGNHPNRGETSDESLGSIDSALKRVVDRFSAASSGSLDGEVEPLWWSNQETDFIGRSRRNNERLTAMAVGRSCVVVD